MQFLSTNTSYHIFNHANGFENVFRDDENYRYFLEKYEVYIVPIAETYAYCLLPNHFHLVIRIRKREVIEELIRNKKNTASINNLSKSDNCSKGPDVEKVVIADEEIERFLSKQFANLFSSYAQSFNKMYKRMGSLFIKNFRREPILNKQHFINAIIYTHRNPIHHGFYTYYSGWGYTSYCKILETKSELVEVEKILKIFGSRDQFIEIHQQNLDKLNQTFEPDAP
jgi:REP element-mobilizing transposase RayT